MASVAFTCSTAWTWNEGLLHLDGDQLVVEYQRTIGGNAWVALNLLLCFLPMLLCLDALTKSRLRIVRVPLAAVQAVTFREDVEVVVIGTRMSALQELPGMCQGRVGFDIGEEHCEDARRLVALVNRPWPITLGGVSPTEPGAPVGPSM